MGRIEKKWEHLGESNPYFTVIPYEKYKSENLNETLLEEFFEGGEIHITRIWNKISEHFGRDFNPRAALDFGCGVGRLALPLAKRCETVLGVDISEKMLEEARRNAHLFGLSNLKFAAVNDFFEKKEGGFDFVHSFIVFQHVKPKTGEKIFKKLIELLNEGGIGALHFTYAEKFSSGFEKLRSNLYRDVPKTFKLRNLLAGKSDENPLPMYVYDLNRLAGILQENDCHECYFEFSDHGIKGVNLFFRKKAKKLY